ncbi:DUF1800 domain-containing protein [Sphaerotilus uruguayifluvii]|uniref:Uncharacterized protein (DUF1800 family) n=1 Tax=Sphaerotilus uruguayifluvii TaxID=2735897 RepID=A0ABX2FWE2_9BURK|nr:DUF1800 domain-containing protein [Leptothrix sp. C29]NRT54319.1 uncharacterized protein (DUF1800 family) [Leptothrix sp. C29]
MEKIVQQRPRRSLRPTTGRGAGALTAFAALAALMTGNPASAQTAATFLIDGVPYTSTACAAEWGTCRFEGTRRVAYGVPGKWLYRYATSSQACSSPAFGKDPAFGQKKFCYATASTVLIPPTTPYPAPLTTAEKQAARLLNQATWGATATEIARVSKMTPAAWVDEQLALPLTTPSHWTYVKTGGPLGTSQFINAFMESYWSQAATAPDQLRQRMTQALAEIFVTSAVSSGIDIQPEAHAAYIDMLAKNAFGNYRQLLEGVSLSPAMGIYLSHMNNQKEDTATGRLPDENYAREVMQLFSIGLWMLNPDGSRQLDASGSPIPTYGIPEVMGMAKVFTGWTWGGAYGSWELPMKNNASITSTSQKSIVNGVVIPAGTDGPASLKIALDTLANHPNVAPFMSEQLIKRFVTSNPSRAYVARVAAVWTDNGRGVRGDLAAVLRAILLDTEARSDTMLGSPTYGKLREPMMRFGHWLRAFNARPNDGVWTIWNLEDPVTSLGQNPQRSPSVFNFFRPDYAPPGPILLAGLTAPEFQITHETTLTGYSNFMSWLAERGFGGKILPDYSRYEAVADNAETLLSLLNLELMAGQMSPATKAAITDVMNTLPVTLANARKLRVWKAVYLVMTSPEYVVQR